MVEGDRLGCFIGVECPFERGRLDFVHEWLDHYGVRLLGKIEVTEFGVVFSFPRPTVIWCSDKCEFVVTDYIVIWYH